MKSKKEVVEKVEELLGDPRVHYSPASVETNAPLALVQVSLESAISILNWVLEEDAVPKSAA